MSRLSSELYPFEELCLVGFSCFGPKPRWPSADSSKTVEAFGGKVLLSKIKGQVVGLIQPPYIPKD